MGRGRKAAGDHFQGRWSLASKDLAGAPGPGVSTPVVAKGQPRLKGYGANFGGARAEG
jgi:hypothetical protein